VNLSDATVLVTGGRSGLGAACVRAIAERGGHVLSADVVPPEGSPDAELAERVRSVPCDVTSEEAVQAVLEERPAGWGPLRGVVHCAGILHAERLVGREGPASLAAFRRVIEVNLVGTFNVCRLAAAAMLRHEPGEEGERGVIVLTSSVAAEEGQIGQAAYSASKGGVAAMTLPLARELGAHGVRVVSIAPGAFETPMMQSAPDKVRQSLIDQTLFPRRLGRPEEFAALVLHVLENLMLNGCVLRLDGGLRMGPR
jgi:NAD(P)-dependent dehydrogenase (short-subunit alcohol dehydrogenase family)